MTLKRVAWIAGFPLVLVALLLTLLAWDLARNKELGPRHEDHEVPDFDYSGADFRDYIHYSREVLVSARPDIANSEVLENLLPFRLAPAQHCDASGDGRHARGILLTHGLIASPYSMRALGEFFQSECFLVLGLLLPDHGTRPGDMLDSDWEEWARAHHFATEYLKQHARQVFLSGHSAGGTLAIREAALNTGIDGLVLFAPALGINPQARFAGLLSWLGHLFPGAAWHEVKPDVAPYRYESFPLKAAYETWQLIRDTQATLEQSPIEIPVFTVTSREDSTVDVDAIMEFMAEQKGTGRTLLYSREEMKVSESTKLVSSAREEEGILSLSHLGLMTPPEHPFYGRDGGYRYCSQYLPENRELYERCSAGEREFYGEMTPQNQQRGLVERIAFNPFYEDMLEDIRNFLRDALPE